MKIIKVQKQTQGYKVTTEDKKEYSIPYIECTFLYKETKAFIDNGGVIEDEFTPEEIAEQQAIYESNTRKSEGEIYTLNDIDYKVSFMKDDADGMMQVSMAFQLGLTETVIHFENGTKMPIKNTEFEPFAIWFVGKRNSFFVEQLEQGGIDGN